MSIETKSNLAYLCQVKQTSHSRRCALSQRKWPARFHLWPSCRQLRPRRSPCFRGRRRHWRRTPRCARLSVTLEAVSRGRQSCQSAAWKTATHWRQEVRGHKSRYFTHRVYPSTLIFTGQAYLMQKHQADCFSRRKYTEFSVCSTIFLTHKKEVKVKREKEQKVTVLGLQLIIRKLK